MWCQAKHPQLLWVNNLVDSLEPSFLTITNGRQYEGGATLGLDNVYAGAATIGQVVPLRMIVR